MDWYLMVWKKFAEFNGRSRRKEYWMFALFNMLIIFALEFVGFMLIKAIGTAGGVILGSAVCIYALAVFIPSLACGVRRLHDTGRSGWWLLIGFVPLVGGLVLLVFTVLDSDPGTNLYGPNPKFAEPQAMMN